MRNTPRLKLASTGTHFTFCLGTSSTQLKLDHKIDFTDQGGVAADEQALLNLLDPHSLALDGFDDTQLVIDLDG